jgi:hypothetical protein
VRAERAYTFFERMHELWAERGYARPAPSWQDTAFSVTLVWITLFGDALFGPTARATVGLADDFETGRRFRRWMVERFEEARPPRAASGRRGRPRHARDADLIS